MCVPTLPLCVCVPAQAAVIDFAQPYTRKVEREREGEGERSDATTTKIN